MSCLQLAELKCFVNETTYKAKLITLPFDVTDCEFLVQFRKNKIGENDNPVAFEWSTSDSTISIVDAVNGKIRMNKRKITTDIGVYVGDFSIKKPNEDLEVYFRFKQEVIQNLSPQ